MKKLDNVQPSQLLEVCSGLDDGGNGNSRKKRSLFAEKDCAVLPAVAGQDTRVRIANCEDRNTCRKVNRTRAAVKAFQIG